MTPCGKPVCPRLGAPSCDFCQDRPPQYRGQRKGAARTGNVKPKSANPAKAG
jgi:hypothetical protein